ncbi:MAG: glycosyltransferase family 4 protein [Kiritimatiellales bacterium]
MHIVQILPELNQGGVERGTVELSRELVKHGHQSTVISAGGSQAVQIEKDGGRHITLDVCSKNPFTTPLRIFRLRKILRELAQGSEVGGRRTEDRGHPLTTSNQQSATPNHAPCGGMILHARSRVPAWLCYFANKQLKIPFVTTVHGFNSVNKYSKIMTRGDAVICVSNPVKKYIQKNYGTPDEKITVIHRGIDPAEFDPEKLDQSWIGSFKKQFGLNEKFVVTAVGRITELKDYETFIQAVVACAHDMPDIRGLIVGGVRHDKQAYYERLQSLVKELHAEDRIIFAGSHSRMPEIYALSDVLVSSSKKPESFGRTLIEAMAMNTPVIATRHGGALDIIKDGINGFLFAPGDVTELADALRRQKEIPREGLREYVLKRFTVAAMAEKTINIYQQQMKHCKEN